MNGYSKLIILSIVIIVIFVIVYFVVLKNDEDEKDVASKELSLKINSINEYISNDKIDIGEKINIPLYYINLDRSEDRRKTLESQLKDTTVNARRVPAVDGKKINLKSGTYLDNGKIINYKIENFEKCPNNKYSESEIACTMSHIIAIDTAYKNGDELALIVEDDVFLGLSSLWKEDLKTLVDKAPENWGIIQLCIGASRDIDLEDVRKRGFFRFLHGYGTVAYIVNKQGMKSFSHFFNNSNIDIINDNFTGIYADGLIYENIENKNLGAYVIFPRFIPNNEKNKSTIFNSDCHDTIKFASLIIDYYLK